MTAQTYINRDEQPIPRAVLRAAGILILAILAVVGWARLSGMEPIAQTAGDGGRGRTRAGADAPRRRWRLTVTDGATGALVADLGPTEGGLRSAAERALAHARKMNGLDMTAPVTVVRWQGGKYSVIDPATGWRTELRAFGVPSVRHSHA